VLKKLNKYIAFRSRVYLW